MSLPKVCLCSYLTSLLSYNSPLPIVRSGLSRYAPDTPPPLFHRLCPDHLNTPSRAHTQETERLVADPAPGIAALPHDDNLRYFDVTIEGPDGSPFQREPVVLFSVFTPLTSDEGGIFKLELFLPEEYPMAPPKVRFLTKIYHPNIGEPSPHLVDRFSSPVKTSSDGYAWIS